MMTWMPNKSLFDSAAALELDQLAVATVEAELITASVPEEAQRIAWSVLKTATPVSMLTRPCERCCFG